MAEKSKAIYSAQRCHLWLRKFMNHESFKFGKYSGKILLYPCTVLTVCARHPLLAADRDTHWAFMSELGCSNACMIYQDPAR